jgi:hypothetical protein
MSILDRSFKYVPASQTDIRKTFRRVRQALAAERERLEQRRQAAVVVGIKRKAAQG